MGSRFDGEVIVGAGAYIELVRCFVTWSDLSSPYSRQHLQLIYNSIVDNWCALSLDSRLKDIQKRLTSTLNKRLVSEVREGIIHTKDLSLTSHIFTVDYLDLILNYYFISPSACFTLGNSELELYRSDPSKEISIKRTMILGYTHSKEDIKTANNREQFVKNCLCSFCEENIDLLRTISLLRRNFYEIKIKGEEGRKISCVKVPMFTKDNFPGVTKIDGLISGYAYVPIFSSDPYKNLYFEKSNGVEEIKPIEDFYK